MEGRALLRIGGTISLALGVFALLFPNAVSDILLSNTASAGLTAFARGEVRAVYGGGYILIGIVPLMASFNRRGRDMIRVLGLLWAAMALGRIVGLVADGLNLFTWLILVLDIVLAYCYLVGAKQAGHAESSSTAPVAAAASRSPTTSASSEPEPTPGA